MRASAAEYKWPDNIPPEAKQLMEPLPLSPTGQAVPGFPDGAPAVSADALKFSDDDIAKLKAGKYTAGLVMHTMDAGWPHLQVAGITNTLKDFGVEVIGATDAKFNVGQQISDLEQMIARKPDVIFSIPIDPKSESEAIQVHMDDDNPYVVGRMFAGGNDIFRGEIHAVPVHDINHAPEPLTAPMLRMLGAQNPATHHFIDAALERLHDRSLTGEVLRFRRFERRIDRQREGICHAERRLENLLLEQNLCEYRLQEAHAVRRIVGELVTDQRTIRYMQGDPQARRDFLAAQQLDFDIERGRSP